MVYLKTEEEIELLRQANLLVGKTLGEIAKIIKVDSYSSYLDFWLDNFLQGIEIESKKNQIKSIELYDKENSKGIKQKRIRKIVA